MICMPPTAGTCAPPRGQPTATSTRPGSAGSGPAGSPTRCLPMTPTNCRCASPPAPCCVPPTFEPELSRKTGDRFAELRELCSAAGDKVSLAIGMTGLATELKYTGRAREGARLSSEQMVLLESIGDPTLTVGLASVAFINWFDAGDIGEILRWSQTVIDLAGGDPVKGAGFGIGSPLAVAVAWRGIARWWLGRPGWRQDLHDAAAMARSSNPTTLAAVVWWTYGGAIIYGVLRPDDSAVRAIEEAAQITAGSSNDLALIVAEFTLGIALLGRDAAADRRRGLALMVQVRERVRERGPFMVPITELWIARESARRGDRDAAIPVMHQALDELHQAGRLAYGVVGTGVLVETLLERGAEGDLARSP